MKKNIIISAMVFALAGATTSCSDFLDKEVDLTQQADNVFSDFDNTRTVSECLQGCYDG